MKKNEINKSGKSIIKLFGFIFLNNVGLICFGQRQAWFLPYLNNNDKVAYSIADSVTDRKDITVLIMEKNGFKQSAINEIGHLKKLRILDLSQVALRDTRKLMSILALLPNLEYLRLDNLNIDTLSFSGFLNSKIRWLSARKCSLYYIDTSISKLQMLEYLNLKGADSDFGKGNFLEDLPYSISTLMNLKALDCTSNRFKTIPSSVFHLKNLQDLSFENNKISNVPNEIKNLESLKSLNLSFNAINIFPSEILQLKNLVKLKLSYCNILSIPDLISQLRFLQEIDLDGNNIREVPMIFKTFNYLENLSMNSCSIVEFPGFLGSSLSIKVLNLASNKIKKIDLIQTWNIRQVNLRENELSENDVRKFVNKFKGISVKN